MNDFGRREFDSLITLNFERNPEYKEIFNSLEPRNILEKITLFTGKSVKPVETLIFFDEVQDCASAIMAHAKALRREESRRATVVFKRFAQRTH